MTAIQAARQNPKAKILLVDRREKIGAKILISGGTRCNVTNRAVSPSDYCGGPPHFVKHVLEAFSPEETIRFFDSIGVELVLEPTGKYFPVTHSGKTVLEALLAEVGRLGVELKTGLSIDEVRRTKDGFEASGIPAKKIALTTGGLSYPETGSDGTGYRIALSLGHSLMKTVPALTPFTTDDADWQSLSGITLAAKLYFYKNGKKTAQAEDSFLFTHFGFSGPAALDLSRHWMKASPDEKRQVFISFLPEQSETTVREALERRKVSNPNQSFKRALIAEFGLPERLVDVLLKKYSGKNLTQTIHFLLHGPLPVTGVVGYKKAEVTAGGVDLSQVRVSSMESKIVPGLYFAGEILDVDGRIGGFNFQWAWSSGTVAGRAAAKSL